MGQGSGGPSRATHYSVGDKTEPLPTADRGTESLGIGFGYTRTTRVVVHL